MGTVELALAYGLDLLLGDPPRWPHPVRWIGAAISKLETWFRRCVSTPTGERIAGVGLALVVPAGAGLLTLGALQGTVGIDPLLGQAAAVYLTYTTLSVKSLRDEARRVYRSLNRGDLREARWNLSRIVGRDTVHLDETGISRATVESVAENTSDGIVAPLFYLAVGGVPLAVAYKAVNTLDSMVGYKNDRYRCFGWASARLDDLANYVPARLTGLLMVLAAFLMRGYSGRKAWKVFRQDGRKHESPNSGVPEAAMAGALGIILGGPNRYQGVAKTRLWIGGSRGGDPETIPVIREHILQANRMTFMVSLLMVGMVGFVWILWK
ncbi:MAG: cobalamin biosynthesis protein CobD [Nitrospirae bacterium]|nr:cobalamin biosynthesis protein CobD [Nitrospirota bacterium]